MQKKMIFLSAATMLLLISASAFAQPGRSNGPSRDGGDGGTAVSRSISGAASRSVSGASAVANPTLKSRTSTSTSTSTNVTVNDTTGGTGSSGTAGDPTLHYSGGYSVNNVPDVVAPAVVGGNPCAIGASGGVAVAGFGLAAGGTWADKACERRQEAALLYNMGLPTVAYALISQDPNVRAAMQAAGVNQLGKPLVPPTVAAVPVTPKIAPGWCSDANTKANLTAQSAGQRFYIEHNCGPPQS